MKKKELVMPSFFLTVYCPYCKEPKKTISSQKRLILENGCFNCREVINKSK